MSIKSLAAFSLALAIAAQPRLLPAQSPQPSASPGPVPSATAAPSATASPAPVKPPAASPLPSAAASASASASPEAKPKERKPVAGKSPAPEPSATPAVIDSLSQGELNDALNLLKENYIKSSSLSDVELGRATLQGLMERLAPGIAIYAQPPAQEEKAPFRAEVLDDRVGYLRLGSLVKGNIDEMDAALLDFNTKGLKSVVLDLRTTPACSDFDLAAEVIRRFTSKGKLLFIVRKSAVKQERIVTSSQDPSFQGLLIVLADKDTAGAGEVIAAVLRDQVNAMVIGSNTAGQAVEFSDLALSSGKILRVAVAEVVLPGNFSLFPKGVKPDIAVAMSPEMKKEVMQKSLQKGAGQFVQETERTRLNEAALVAGTNPEIDAIEAAQRAKASGERKVAPLRDLVLQRALDLVTSIGIYQAKPAAPAGN